MIAFITVYYLPAIDELDCGFSEEEVNKIALGHRIDEVRSCNKRNFHKKNSVIYTGEGYEPTFLEIS